MIDWDKTLNDPFSKLKVGDKVILSVDNITINKDMIDWKPNSTTGTVVTIKEVSNINSFSTEE